MATPITPLLIRYGRLGDMLLQEPLLHLLRQRYGAPCRIISAGNWTGALYAAHPDVGTVRVSFREVPLGAASLTGAQRGKHLTH